LYGRASPIFGYDVYLAFKDRLHRLPTSIRHVGLYSCLLASGGFRV
jgi:hypothetical protein